MPSADTPDYVRPEVGALRPKRQRARALWGGTDAVQAAREQFLPKWGGEHADEYAQRATLTEVFGAFPRTVQAAVGMVFATPPDVVEPPAAFVALLDDVDGLGTALPVFARRVFEDAMVDGLAGILVDHPPVAAPGTVSVADARAQGLRPYWVPVTAAQVINWRVGVVSGRPALTLLVLEEQTREPDGAYGTSDVTRYRVFRRDAAGVTAQVYVRTVRLDGGTERVTFDAQTPEPLPIVGPAAVPFAPVAIGRGGALLDVPPPLDDLACLAVGHYRVAADRRWLMHVCHAPTLAIEGYIDDASADAVRIGPNALLKLPPGQTAKWVQADADALDSSRAEKEDLKGEMAALGMAFLAQDRRRAPETATGRRLDGAAEHATLAVAARALQDGLSNALALTAAYLGQAEAAPPARVATSYDEGTLDAQTITALSGLARERQITVRTLLETLKAGRVLPETLDVEQEELDVAAAAAAAEVLAEREAARPPAPEPAP
mgnify:CR=1 FL=1